MTHFVAATGWFYVFSRGNVAGELIVDRVAAFAGRSSAEHGTSAVPLIARGGRLEEPGATGTLVHETQLSESELAAARRR